MFKLKKWSWWNTTGPVYRSRIARLRAARQKLEPTLNLELPRVISEEENDILTKELPQPLLPSAQKDDKQKLIWGSIIGFLVFAGIITTVVIIKKRKGAE